MYVTEVYALSTNDNKNLKKNFCDGLLYSAMSLEMSPDYEAVVGSVYDAHAGISMSSLDFMACFDDPHGYLSKNTTWFLDSPTTMDLLTKQKKKKKRISANDGEAEILLAYDW
uniref:Uncharacterized protein n=1 Tax=Glossina pallidipes TaxID=7398 RepID=A0A1B0A677_GLOPL